MLCIEIRGRINPEDHSFLQVMWGLAFNRTVCAHELVYLCLVPHPSLLGIAT